MFDWLEKVPWWMIVFAAIAFAVVPLGESHFLQKWGMLSSGTLKRPLDWFDLVMHSAPLFLLGLKFVLFLRNR